LFIEVDTHFHTVASTHAYSTVKEIAQCAAQKGLKGFAMTDHAPASPDAPHIWHFRNLRVIPDYIDGVRVIRGAEANIVDFSGNIDMHGSDFEFVDFVIASYHSAVVKPADVQTNTNGYINIARNCPEVNVIGHPGSTGFEFDIKKALLAFKEYDKLVEINESSMLYKKGAAEINAQMLRICKQYSIPVVVSTDGHYCEMVGEVSTAEHMINDLDFPYDLIVNRKADELYSRIKAGRPNFKVEK